MGISVQRQLQKVLPVEKPPLELKLKPHECHNSVGMDAAVVATDCQPATMWPAIPFVCDEF